VTRASEVEGERLYSADGELTGTLVNMLFHPSGEPVIVGAAVRPPNAMVVVGRRETYIPLSALRFKRGHIWLVIGSLPKAKASADKLGYNPDLTVIWTGMPVQGPSGTQFGAVSDFEFDPESGVVGELAVREGATANAAYGELTVPADAVVGYADGAVRVTREGIELDASGGTAKAAAAAAAGASVAVAAVGDIVGEKVVQASSAAGRAIKAVKESQVAEKAVRRVGSTWRDSVKAFKDGMKDE
jgi:hypothetical protein